MHAIKRAVGEQRIGGRPLHRVHLQDIGLRRHEILPGNFAFSRELFHKVVYSIAILGVHHGQTALGRCRRHSCQHLVIGHHHAPFGVRHKHLEGRHPHLYQPGNFRPDVIFGHERPVNGEIKIGYPLPFLNHFLYYF